jgi:hypothetical protein
MFKPRRNKLWLFISILGFLIVSGVIPFDLEIAPERRLQIVNAEGQSLGGARVRQILDQYSLKQSWEEEVQANSSGEVFLPKRIIRTSVLSLVRGAMAEFREVGIHASFRSNENILIDANGFPPHIYSNGKGLKRGKAVIRKGPLGKTIIGSER